MESVSVRVFRAHLTDYAERASAGEQIVVRRRGRPVALLRAAAPREQLASIGFHQLRASMGRALRAADRGHSWLITYHGNPQLILSPVPEGLVPMHPDDEWDEETT